MNISYIVRTSVIYNFYTKSKNATYFIKSIAVNIFLPLRLPFLTNSYIFKKNRTRVDQARNIAAFPTIIAHVSSWRGVELIFLRVSLTRQIGSRQRVVLLYTVDFTVKQLVLHKERRFTRFNPFFCFIDFCPFLNLLPANYLLHIKLTHFSCT